MTRSPDSAIAAASRLLGRKLELAEVFTAGQHALTLLASDSDSGVIVRAFPAGDDAVARETAVLDRLLPLLPMVPQLIAASADPREPLIITTKVSGSTPDPETPPDTIAHDMAAALVRIHALDGTGLPATPQTPPPGESAIAVRTQREWSSLDMDDPVLTHTDFWTGNALWARGCLTGIVDWSGASCGPRGVDLAWCRQDLVLLGFPEAAGIFLAEYERLLGRRISDISAWDVQAAARAHDRVETWLPNYHGIGRTDITAEDLRHRLDAWNATL
ncbi:phosphotransferase family protein [Brevibacterium spongiae]|uniref:Phosphotransferase n=1 Tax=Brevibacterium spongiae TaxID=2909672 RepID=A0ABY5SPR6_9MICO|nr:phosphotransferase [Brevibacterium spongiae]UVI36552.1 phosphotransferase [Brevibacterium spongiae]